MNKKQFAYSNPRQDYRPYTHIPAIQCKYQVHIYTWTYVCKPIGMLHEPAPKAEIDPDRAGKVAFLALLRITETESQPKPNKS